MSIFGYNEEIWGEYLKVVDNLSNLLGICYKYISFIDKNKTMNAAVQLYKLEIILFYYKGYTYTLNWKTFNNNFYTKTEKNSYFHRIEKIINNVKKSINEDEIYDLQRVFADESHATYEIIDIALLLNQQNNELFIESLLDFSKEAQIIEVARCANNENIRKLENLIIENGQVIPMFNFLCKVYGCNREKLKEKIIEILKVEEFKNCDFIYPSDSVLSKQEFKKLVLEFKNC